MNPKPTDEIDLAFGKDLLPTDIPDHYKDMSLPSVFMICIWYYHGQPIRLAPHDKVAMDHITACLKSYRIDDSRKITGCAYLLDQFFRIAIWQDTIYQLGVLK